MVAAPEIGLVGTGTGTDIGVGVDVVAQEALGHEQVRVVVPFRVAVEVREIGKHNGSLWDPAVLVRVTARGGVWDAQASDGCPSMDFLDEGAHVGQIRFVFP